MSEPLTLLPVLMIRPSAMTIPLLFHGVLTWSAYGLALVLLALLPFVSRRLLRRAGRTALLQSLCIGFVLSGSSVLVNSCNEGEYTFTVRHGLPAAMLANHNAARFCNVLPREPSYYDWSSWPLLRIVPLKVDHASAPSVLANLVIWTSLVLALQLRFRNRM